MTEKNQSWMAAGLIFSLLLFSGCPLFLLSAGAAGGYAISKDTIEGILEKPFNKVYKASREAITYEGFIRSENPTQGIIEANVRSSKVDIHIRQMTERTVRLQVRARTGYNLLPDVKLANEIYNKIIGKLK